MHGKTPRTLPGFLGWRSRTYTPYMAAKLSKKKIYVLDTSVILHDNNAVNNFEENDIAIPITVLEELDHFKEGSSTKNYEARAFIRFIDKLSGKFTLQDWIPFNGPEKGRFKVIMPQIAPLVNAEVIFDDNKPDHKILNAALELFDHEHKQHSDRLEKKEHVALPPLLAWLRNFLK